MSDATTGGGMDEEPRDPEDPLSSLLTKITNFEGIQATEEWNEIRNAAFRFGCLIEADEPNSKVRFQYGRASWHFSRWMSPASVGDWIAGFRDGANAPR